MFYYIITIQGCNMKKKVISVRIDEQIWKTAKKYAIDRGLTFGELVETALIHEMQKR